ncbi:MAG: Na+/H+ antiporter subunit D [Phycisphaeraceae bacterium]|nr:Na+/H+ antiporter subunit D [Phycisphaeraceae bacterium]
MNLLLVLPILIPLTAAALGLTAWKRPGLQRSISVAGAMALLVASVMLLAATNRGDVLATQMGGWEAPYGITIVADILSSIMVLLNAIIGLAVVIYSLGALDPQREAFGFHPLVHALLAAVSGAFLTGDLFNLYVWFEVMLMSSFVLLTMGSGRAQLEGAIKYVALNLVSSALFLAAVGLLYGATGTLNMAHLAERIGSADPRATTLIAMLFMVAFGIKAAAFPFFFWLPASYHTPPPVVSALFAGLLTKVGVYALIRTFTLCFTGDMAFTHEVILWIAGFTMLSGVLGAAVQSEFRRILSFHIVSQIGYMLMGLGMAGVALAAAESADESTAVALRGAAALALTGSIFYVMHHIIVKTNLFLVSGIVQRLFGTGDLDRVGGIWRTRPVLSIMFLVPAMSLAGIPILSGFWAKLTLVRAGLLAESWWIVAVALFVSLLTLFSMTKIWGEAFWNAMPPGREDPTATVRSDRGLRIMMTVVMLLGAVTLAIGFAAQPVFDLAGRAAKQLLSPGVYADAVLGGRQSSIPPVDADGGAP